MSVIELATTYDITGPRTMEHSNTLCSSCKIKGKSFLCLVIKKRSYPYVKDCKDYKPI